MAITRSAHISSMLEMLPPFALRVAATLRLSEHIEAHPDLPGLARATGTDADALGRLLRYLVTLGLYREPEPDRFEVAPAGRVLAGRGRVGLRDWLDLDGAGGRMELALAGLLHTVRTGEPGFDAVFGHSFWDDLAADPDRAASFDALMAAKSAPVAADLAARDWAGTHRLVDIGGGAGLALVEILRASPGLQGVLLERPETADRARHALERAGLAGRAEVVAGSFLDGVPEGGDAYLLFDVLHNWGDREALGILRRCAEAAVAGGRVLVVEDVPATPDDRDARAADLKMLALFGGRQRDEGELRELGAAAGLAGPVVERLPRGFAVVTFTVGTAAGGAAAAGAQRREA